jgi:hypothetical protein
LCFARPRHILTYIHIHTKQILVGSAIVFCKAKTQGRLSVQSLIQLDNDARRRLGIEPKDGTVGVSLLSGIFL